MDGVYVQFPCTVKRRIHSNVVQNVVGLRLNHYLSSKHRQL